jgi:ubiquinone/menaquinone biosynthesis C-methylase UbiE
MESFAKFEHEGWQRVAGKYDSVWASSTRQFIPPLLDAAEVSGGMSVLDVGCGPGYVSAAAAARGANPRGLDFSKEMIGIAQRMFPEIEFQEGDAQNLPFVNATFDRVLANFTLLHVPDPERACAEACRVLKPAENSDLPWAALEENPYAKMIDNAIREHADLEVDLPAGPPYHLFSGAKNFAGPWHGPDSMANR